MPGSSSLADLEITCHDCGDAFLQSDAERRYYQGRSLSPPDTCPDCRAIRRARRNADLVKAHAAREDILADRGVPLFGGYGDSTATRQSRGPNRNGGGRRFFRAVCSACGRGTEVPFEPRGDRPVFCRECYNARRGR